MLSYVRYEAFEVAFPGPFVFDQFQRKQTNYYFETGQQIFELQFIAEADVSVQIGFGDIS